MQIVAVLFIRTCVFHYFYCGFLIGPLKELFVNHLGIFRNLCFLSYAGLINRAIKTDDN